jgi:predicted O-methyltransferase YrrM
LDSLIITSRSHSVEKTTAAIKGISMPVSQFVFRMQKRIQARLGLISDILQVNYEPLDPKLADIIARTVEQEEAASPQLELHEQGSFLQGDRLAEVAELCAQRKAGDFIEIGCYIGETTRRLAEVAHQYGRRITAVDPWETGTQNCEGWEYEAFLKNIEPYASVVDIVRDDSTKRRTIARIRKLNLCFAYVDGLHTYAACLSDIRAVAHTHGIIAVDDIYWSYPVTRAVRRGAYLTRRTAVHHPACREGYLLTPDGGPKIPSRL